MPIFLASVSDGPVAAVTVIVPESALSEPLAA